MKKKFITAIVSALILGLSSTTFAVDNQFSDVPDNHWAFTEVNTLAENDIVNSYNDGTFKGNRNTTRYEMAVMLANIHSKRSPATNAVTNNPFRDVISSHWAYKSLMQLAADGIIAPDSNGLFRGNTSITRYEMAIMVTNLLTKDSNVIISESSNPFNDVPVNHRAYKAVATLVKEGLVEGYGDGGFHGNNNMTRYETAMVLYNVYKKLFN